MDKIIKTAVEEYQCPGCVVGHNIECYEKGKSEECDKHVAGTTAFPGGRFFLGMPKGFNKVGAYEEIKINIFKNFSDGWGYDKFNIPVWKHKDKFCNTFVRGLSPRISKPFLHIFLENCVKEIECLEITEEDFNEMD